MTSPPLASLLPLIESGFHGAPALVVGDVMLDQYVWGEVDRISPEAPVPVVRVALRDAKPGGAANVAMNLAGLGAAVTLVGFAGPDSDRETLQRLVTDAGIEPLLTTAPQSATTSKLRILCGHQQMMRLDTEASATFTAFDYDRLLHAALSAIPHAAALVLSDYAKGVLSEPLCQVLIREARANNLPVLVDPKSRSFHRYRGATIICPNRKELALATAEPASDLDRLLTAGQALTASLGLESMAVTLGEQGIAVLRKDSRLHLPAVVRQVYDVSGAGDTVAAVLALALACRLPIETAADLANLAAGIVVSKVGTVPIRSEELLGAISQQTALTMDEKVIPLGGVLSRVAAWRSSGQRIVFTNGCFDILHIGHIRLLAEARRRGDRLIVAINSDDSVRQLKGPLRPVVGEHERARVLAALSAVDAVVVFGESTPLRLIETIRPDVLVKGGDYTQDNVVGAREVRAWGGRVELIPLVEGISTTRLIAAAAPPPPTSKGLPA